MARYTYQGVITPPSPSVAIVADAGDITDRSGTYYFWMQVRNRAGFSAVSPSVSAVVTVNARVDITIPSNLIPVANGMYIHSIYILANTTNNPATATIVCGIPYYELDEVTPRSLPVTIQLGADHHFELGKEVDYYSELPVNPCAGQRVYVEQDDRDDPTVDFNTIVEYQPFAAVPGWYEAFDQEFSTYLSDPTTASGALASISAASRVIPTLYTLGISANDRSPSRPIGIWLINNAAQPISVGTRVGMSFAIGEDNVSADFVGRMQIIFRGYVNTATGVNNTSDGDGGTMLLINEPIDYSGETIEVLKLQKEVPVGYAVWLDVRAISTLEELNNRAPIGARIKISPYFFSFRSTQTPPDLFGGYIADAQDRRLIVPGTGLTAKALRGSGKVQFNSLGTAFTFWNAEEQTIASLASNTADQSIVITKEGNCLLLDDVTNTTQLRAIVGTVNGVGAPSDWSSPIALNGSQRLGFTITHPVSFRDDYPDSLLAGQSYATYNGYGFRIYIRLVGGAASYWDVTTNTGSLTTAITIGGTAGVVGEPAIPGDTYFGLHLVDTFATALSTASTVFAAGSYEVCVAPIYQGTVSSINNDPDDGIITIRTTFAETLERSTYWLSAISDPLTLRSFTGERRGGMRVPLNNSSSFFYWDSANTDADDGVDTIAVTGVATGRFKRFVNLNTLDPGAGVVLDGILEAEIGDEFRLLAPIASFVLATNAVPTAGQLGTNNVAYASVTTLRPYEDGSINNILNTIVAGTIVVVANAVTRFYYNVTAIADSGSYRSFTVTYLGYRGSVAAWTNGETIVLSIVQTSASVIALIDGAIGTAWKTDPATLTPDDLDDTSTANKFITAAELVKLAGIETGATADQLAADVPTAGSFTNFTPSSANVQAALAAIDTEIGVLSGNAVGDGDKGDITVTTGGTVWTIDPQAVTYAKIQNVTAQRLLGRSSSTAGTIEEIQIGGGLSLAGGVLQNTVAASYTNLAIAARTSTAFQVTSSTGVAADIPQATNSLAGLLNAADKTKLDTVQTNATPDTKEVFVDAIDTVPSFLDRKFLEGTGITLTYSTNAILGRQITFANEWVNGAYSIKFQAPTIAADYTYTLPANYGTDGYVLKTNGAGALTWVAQTAPTVIAPVDEVWINAGMIVPGTINGATEGSYSTTIATYDVLNFNQTTEQDGFFTIVFGQKWNAGTIKAKFYWIASAGTGDCIWGIQAVSVSSATNLDQTFGTAQEVTQTLSAVDQLLISSATAAITIGNTPAVEDLIQFRVYRKAAAGGDTLSGTASLIGVEIQYTQVQTGVAW